MSGALLEVRGLAVVSDGTSGRAARTIVDGIDLVVERGRRVGIVGESGSGKSMTAAAVLGLLPEGVRVGSGTIELDGVPLANAPESVLRTVRGRRVSIVYQNALGSLNPVVAVGRQIADVARVHLGLSAEAARTRAVELMTAMGIPDAADRARDYPHQFSGGMAQRVAIAMALVCEPDLVIADEPTTGLDATVQVQVLGTIGASVARTGSALLLISHDLGAIERMTDEVVVLYAGIVLEHGTTEQIMGDPLSPYTAGLVAASAPDGALTFIPGRIPDAGEVLPDSCPFAARCPLVSDRCRTARPALRTAPSGRSVACHNVEPR